MSRPKLRILHLHSSFQAGGKELRSARLMNAFGPECEHTIVSAEPGAFGAGSAIDPAIPVSFPADFPLLTGRPTPARLQRIARAMLGHDLVLTYNWGAMDGVMAHTLFSKVFHLPPLVHHEDGFNQDEAVRLKPLRNWYRRIALAMVQALIVPSEQLEDTAIRIWQQPPGKVHRIINGIPTMAYGRKTKRDVLPRVIKHPGEMWLGTLAGLRAVKNLPRLVRAFAAMPDHWHLVILGEGPERAAIRAEAVRLGIGHRVHLPGFAADPAQVLGLFDLFALSSDSEQFPISVVEAMAAGLAVVSPMVGDVAMMVAEENRPYLAAAGDEAELAEALCVLASNPKERRLIGAANRRIAREEFDEARMILAYRAVYARAMRRRFFP
jgi:glycosyltransferase involved in cell wall biosynthesis